MKKFVRQPQFGKGISPIMSDQWWLLAILAAGSFVFAMVVVFIVSMFRDIQISAWSVVGSIAPWYVAVMAGWIVYFQIPLFVSHGRTRKAGFREWVLTGVGFAPLGAALMSVGFLLEGFIYDLAGFTTEAESDRLYSGTSDLPEVFLQYLFTFAAWYALGGFIGGSLYRSVDWGWISIPVSVGIVTLTGSWDHTGGGLFGVLRRIVPGINYGSLWLDFGLSAVAVAIGVGLAWLIVSELPLRNP